MDRIVLPLRASDIGQPLGSQTGPLQGMGHHEVVQERSVLLPDLVLFIDDPLLHSLIICWTIGVRCSGNHVYK